MAVAGVRVLLRSTGRHVHVSRGFHPCAPAHKLVQFNLTDIGEGIKEVTVKNWFIKENDEVRQFDDICEVESDKATVSITSRFDGKVTRLYYNVGDTAAVGKPLVDIDVPEESGDSVGTGDKQQVSKEPVTVTGQDSDSAEVGETQSMVSVTEKPVTKIDQDSDDATEDIPYPIVGEFVEETPRSEEVWNKSLATPAVRRIAMENKIKLSELKGTGKKGRVMKEDILTYIEKNKGRTVKMIDKRIPLTNLQKAMSKTMTESLKIPQFGFSDQIDVSTLVKFRKEAKEEAIKKGIKLTFVPFFLKAISKGLIEYPIINTSFDAEKEEIIYKSSHNIGVAVDSPQGLIVPNIKDVQNLTITGIAKELERLRDLAEKMKLPPSDLSGGTFTVSNIGNISGTSAAPVILPPQVAILGICRIQRLPRFDSTGNVVPVDILSISWSADHRIIDGATVARCTEVFTYYLQHPAALVLDL